MNRTRDQTQRFQRLAADCGFALAGVARAVPSADFDRYESWVRAGMAADMRYLTDHRRDLRSDPRRLLTSVRSVLCVGVSYHTPYPHSSDIEKPDSGWISRYAWGEDYHRWLRARLERLMETLRGEFGPFDHRIAVDTAPLLERTYARQAGLGWIGKNTCLIHQGLGSWFFLGAVLVSLEWEPGTPPPDRCGTCRRCIDACPTRAIVPGPAGGWCVDSRLCISCHTIEARGPIPEAIRPGIGRHVFGCDICQEVCPWNRKAPAGADPAFRPRCFAPPLSKLAALSEEEFRRQFGLTPVERARFRGFLRNVAVAMGNLAREEFRPALQRLAEGADPLVAEHARWALGRLGGPAASTGAAGPVP